jgi:23S rRNA pseudouridine1911/1915/1917 synthase
VDDTGRRLRANSEVRGGAVTLEVPPPEIPYHLEPDPTIPISVIYEDDDVLIVDKQAGLVVHPAPGHWRGTLVNALLARGDHYGGIAGVARPGIVHRLDRDTSGLLIVARNDAAQQSVMAQLKARRVRKTYLALVQGSVNAALGRIEAPIGRDPKDRKRMAVVRGPGGKPARTCWKVLERYGLATLVQARLDTGRTHQIRVHLAALRLPVVGDPVYGGRVKKMLSLRQSERSLADALLRLLRRQALHAAELEFLHPATGERLHFRSDLPTDFSEALERLRAFAVPRTS